MSNAELTEGDEIARLRLENARLRRWIAAAIDDIERDHPGQALVSLLNAQEGEP